MGSNASLPRQAAGCLSLTSPVFHATKQGLPKDERAAVGRVPVPIGVELTEDLVGQEGDGLL